MSAPKRLRDGGQKLEAPPIEEIRCAVCRAAWFEQPTADLARTFCERGPESLPAYKDIDGRKHPGVSGCPYKRDTE